MFINVFQLPTVEDRVKAVLEGMTIRPEGVTTRQKHEIKIRPESITRQKHEMVINKLVLIDFSLIAKAAPHECVIRTGQP